MQRPVGWRRKTVIYTDIIIIYTYTESAVVQVSARTIMFKTVRAQHGAGDSAAELQYTILPQSDDRSPSSASSGEDEPTCAADHHHHHQQKHHMHQHHQQQHHHCHRRTSAVDSGTRRTVLIIVAMLVLGCGVVAAAVLVPILLAARLVSSVPTSARLQTFAVAASGVIHSARGDYVQLLPVKHAPPGTVIEFEPLHQRPPPAPYSASTNRRKKRSGLRVPPAAATTAASTAAKRSRPVERSVNGYRHRFRRPGSAVVGFRPLDFRIRQ